MQIESTSNNRVIQPHEALIIATLELVAGQAGAVDIYLGHWGWGLIRFALFTTTVLVYLKPEKFSLDFKLTIVPVVATSVFIIFLSELLSLGSKMMQWGYDSTSSMIVFIGAFLGAVTPVALARSLNNPEAD